MMEKLVNYILSYLEVILSNFLFYVLFKIFNLHLILIVYNLNVRGGIMYNNIFQRVEEKYLITKEQKDNLLKEIVKEEK